MRSTPPSREATSPVTEYTSDCPVAIHAPLAGGDRPVSAGEVHRHVAIHAPLAGGDLTVVVIVASATSLRSTPPSREATLAVRMRAH